jgi:hypothetical protein
MTCQVIRTAPGPRMTVEFKRGLDDSLTVVALEDALGQANAWSALRPSAAAKGPSKNKFQVSLDPCQFSSSLCRGLMV